MAKVNPFRPNSPIPTAMFAGRLNEIQVFEDGLHQTKNGNPNSFLLTGERGIGKSSLLMLFKPVANGGIPSLGFGTFNFVTINLSISERTNLTTFVELIGKNLKRELGKIESVRSFLDKSWTFIQRIKVMDSGVEADTKNEDTDSIIDDFAYSLSETCKRIANPEKNEEKRDGIVLFIDEADNSSVNLHLGYFIKIVTEKLQLNGCNNIMFVVAGLPATVEKLMDSHESSIRIFTRLKIKELDIEDRCFVIDKAIEAGNKNNDTQTTITDSAKNQLSRLSDGYPHFIQQFGHSAYDFNEDGEISEDDVLDAAFKDGGAIDAIGSRYYEAPFHEQIKSDEYREVLSIMAGKMSSWVKKSEIRKEFSGSGPILTNALKALTTRKIILKNSSKNGEYRLQQRGFALWIKLFGDRDKNR